MAIRAWHAPLLCWSVGAWAAKLRYVAVKRSGELSAKSLAIPRARHLLQQQRAEQKVLLATRSWIASAKTCPPHLYVAKCRPAAIQFAASGSKSLLRPPQRPPNAVRPVQIFLCDLSNQDDCNQPYRHSEITGAQVRNQRRESFGGK